MQFIEHLGRHHLGCGFFFLSLLVSVNTYADRELIGQLKVEDFLLQPTMQVTEKKRGGFELANSFIRFKWSNQDLFSAHFGVGSKSMRQNSILTGAAEVDSTELAMTDAYAQAGPKYFWVRLGLQRVGYGYSSLRGESGQLFPTNIVTETNLFPQRDFAFAIGAEHKQYSTKIMAFNGESGENKDQEAWLSGLWIYQDGTSTYGFSGITTHLTPQKVNPSNTGLWIPEYIVGERSKFRLLNMFAEVDSKQFKVVLEFHKGELIQTTKKSLFDAWSVSMDWLLSGSWHFAMQVDNFDPDQGTSEKSFRRTSFGIIKSAKNSLSTYGLLAIKNTEAPNEFLVNDQLVFFVKVAPALP